MSSGYVLDLLAVGPHPDDVEIFCGGLLAKTARSGRQVGVLDLSRGELSSQGSLAERELETKAASAELGLSLRENLGLPDGEIGTRPDALTQTPDSQLGLVVGALRRLRPAVLAIPYWEARHPDHSSASDLLTRAVFFAGVKNFTPLAGSPYTPSQLLYYQMRHEFRPSFVCDVTEVHSKKMAAVRCYSSQVKAPSGGAAPTLLSSPLSLQSMEARDRYYGAMVGVMFAEPFLMRNMLAIADPVEYFGNAAGGRSYIFPAMG